MQIFARRLFSRMFRKRKMHSERTDEYGNGDEREAPVQSACASKADAVFFECAGVSHGTDGANRKSWDRGESDF